MTKEKSQVELSLWVNLTYVNAKFSSLIVACIKLSSRVACAAAPQRVACVCWSQLEAGNIQRDRREACALRGDGEEEKASSVAMGMRKYAADIDLCPWLILCVLKHV